MDSSFFEQRAVSSKRVIVTSIIGLVAVAAILGTFYSSSSQPTFLLDVESSNENYFQYHLEMYGKKYTGEEYLKRMRIFNDNMGYIRKFNTFGNTWYLKPNQFTDLTNAEFRAMYLPNKLMPQTEESLTEEAVSYPNSVDWTTQGVVTPVKNQGQCGSCWAFSTTGAVESAWKLAGHSLISLSEQQLVDCSPNHGCNGGWPTVAMQYIITNKGIALESTYPYAAQTRTCNKSLASEVAATLSSYKTVTANSVSALATAVAQQPVSVLVDAGGADWQSYGGGVVTDGGCGTSLDHAVLAVGYNMGNSPPYWKVKNSWGTSWGESGYIRLAVVNGQGVCGVQMSPCYPVV